MDLFGGLLEVNAVKGTSATSARETQVLLAWSKMASVYSMVVPGCPRWVVIGALTWGTSRRGTYPGAPPRPGAPTVGAP